MTRRKPVDLAATPVPPRRYRDPEAFLRAVALGDYKPATLAQRIRAAGMLLRAGTPVSVLPPKARAQQTRAERDAERLAAWEEKAKVIRAKFGRA